MHDREGQRIQILCLSCNQAKARKRECPHQAIRRLALELEEEQAA
jgi:hypothetical protein